ncbi:alpha-ribazole phosphatase [Hymenobacter fastidiosus]|uniref:Alpha-ribazole phosphatase n=1 Tax=Hymenobacter fastidiosus TaxID=486264 RepID=A0ABP7RT04_9BACT
MELYLIRHTAVAATGLCYGHSDVPLADTFAAEATRLRAKLPVALPPDASAWRVLSSPAARCRRLAETLWPATAVEEDARLRELHFGTWENRPWAELPAAELDPWMADFVAQAPPGGETFAHLHERTGALLAELLATPAAGPVALVTHAGAVRSLLCHALGLPLAQAFQLVIDFASVSGLRHQHGRWEVRFVNR